MKRLSVSLRKQAAMHITRVSLGTDRLVYVIVQNKLIHYPWDTSHIAYIGTTKNGISRMAESAAFLTDRILSGYGVTSFDVRVVTCRPRPHVKTWHKLERGLLLAFRGMYGDVPKHNTQGKRMKETDEFKLFSRTRLEKVLSDIG